MKIVSLQAENIKRLKAVEITPDGALVEIAGKNGAGKTSVLDSIWWALEGAKNIQASPIRKGATKGRIRLDLGELIVERRFNAQKNGGFTTSITVSNAEGARFAGPQAMLDNLIGALAFDPLRFARMKPAEQRKALTPFVDLDLDAIDALNRTDYDARTDLNREAKTLGSRADAIDVPEHRPEPLDEAALVRELSRAGEHNAAIQRAADAIESDKASRERCEIAIMEEAAKVERVQAARAELVAEIAAASPVPAPVDEGEVQARINAAQEELRRASAHNQACARAQLDRADAESRLARADDALNDAAKDGEVAAGNLQRIEAAIERAPKPAAPINTAEVEAKIGAARVSNENTRRWDERERLREAAAKARSAASALTRAMETRAAEKLAAIAASELPVEGLGITTECVTLDGLPFEVASDAQQLLVSVAIAAAMNPKLRVIRVRDGSLLDKDNLAMMAAFAAENDLQIWIERVDMSGKVGVVIEDGMLAQASE